jgi:NADH dehydrogenase/NADH:ubiquinone oxidoreductase subunit G
MADLGLPVLSTKSSLTDKKLVFLLNTNNFDFSLLSTDCFVVYIGSHGTLDATLSDIVLPGLSFTEKKSSYLNAQGTLQNTFRALFGPGDSREDWKIFGALICSLGNVLPFSNLTELHQFYTKDSLVFQNMRQSSSVLIESKKAPSSFLGNVAFNKGLTNFYLSDIITENSQVMAECSKNRLKVNFN